MDVGIGYRIAPDQFVFLVDVDVVSMAIIAFSVLLSLARIFILLALHVRLVVPTIGGLALLAASSRLACCGSSAH